MPNLSSRMMLGMRRSTQCSSNFYRSPFSRFPLGMRSASCRSSTRFWWCTSRFLTHSLKRPLFVGSGRRNGVSSLSTCVSAASLCCSSQVMRHSSRSFMVSPLRNAPTPRLRFAFFSVRAKNERTGRVEEEDGKKIMNESEKGEEQAKRSARRPPTLPASGAPSLLHSTSATLSSSSSSFFSWRKKNWYRLGRLFSSEPVSSSSSTPHTDSFSSSLPFLQEDAESFSSENSSPPKSKRRHSIFSQSFSGGTGESGSPLSFSSSRARERVDARRMQTEELQALCRLTNGKPIPSVLRVTCRTTSDTHLEWIDITCVNAGNTSSMEWGKGLKEYLSVLGVPSGEAMTSSNYFSFPHASVLDGCQCAFTRIAARQTLGEGMHSLQSLTDRLSLFILEIPSPEEMLETHTTGLHSESPQAAAPTAPPSSPAATKDTPATKTSSSTPLVKTVRSAAHRRRRKMAIQRQRRWAALRSPSSLLLTHLPTAMSNRDRVPFRKALSSSFSPSPAHYRARTEEEEEEERGGRRRSRRLPPSRGSGMHPEAMWREIYAEKMRRKRGKGMPHPVPTASTPPTMTTSAVPSRRTNTKDCNYCHHIAFFNSPELQADASLRSTVPVSALPPIRKAKRGTHSKRKKGKKGKKNTTDHSSLSSHALPRTLFITAHRMPLFCVHELHLDWEKKSKEAELLSKLLYFFMKRVLGSYLHNLVKCMVEFDGLETSVLRSDMNKEVLTRKMYDIKRRVAVYERCLSLTQETYAHVVAALPTVDKDNRFYELQHRMANAEGLAKDLCSDADSALQLLFQYSSYEVNELMRFLTLFSAFFIPLNFLTSIYGMNFEGIPLVDSAHGGWCLTGVFLLAIGGLITVFRRRKFL